MLCAGEDGCRSLKSGQPMWAGWARQETKAELCWVQRGEVSAKVTAGSGDPSTEPELGIPVLSHAYFHNFAQTSGLAYKI